MMVKKILHIDTELLPNQILKDGSNLVRQITDKAQNIPFVQSDDAKKPVYNYDGYFEFTGANYQHLKSKFNMLQLFQNDAYFECYIYLTSDTTTYGRIIMNIDSAGTSKGRLLEGSNGTSLIFYLANAVGSLVGVTMNGISAYMDKWTHLIIAYRDGYLGAFLDGFYINKAIFTGGQDVSSDFYLGTYSTNPNYPSNAKIKFLKSYQDTFPIDYSAFTLYNIGMKYFEPNLSGFSFYKRYKDDGNKKLFLSSRYLKDAVINSSDEVASILPSITEFEDLNITAGNIKITKNGFLGDTRTYNLLSGFYYPQYDSNAFLIGVKDVYVGGWFNIIAADLPTYSRFYIINIHDGANYSYFQVAVYPAYIFISLYDLDTATRFTYTYSISMESLMNSYHYLSATRIGTKVNVYLDGVLIIDDNTSVLCNIPTHGNGSTKMFGSIYWYNNANAWYIDDILFSVGDSIIDPTGYTVDDKVFEPPRRRSLEVKQYEGRKFYENVGSLVNSRYTENAVIGSAGDVSSIYSDIVNVQAVLNGTAAPILEGKNGFKMTGLGRFNMIISGLTGVVSYTCSFWFRKISNPVSTQPICGVAGSSMRFDLRTTGALQFNQFSGTDYTTEVLDNGWHHVCFVKNGSSGYCFLDGVKKANISITVEYSSDSLTWGTTSGLNAYLDDMYFYKGMLGVINISAAISEKAYRKPRRSSSQPQLIL